MKSMNRKKEENRIWRTVFVLLIFMVVLLAVAVFLFWMFSVSFKPEEGFQPLPDPPTDKLQWVFITRDGGELSEYAELLPDTLQLEEMAGMPVTITVCSADKFLNLVAAGKTSDVVTRCYIGPKLKRFETSGMAENLQWLLNRELPDFQLSNEFLDWCGNTKGDVYAYPHTSFTLTMGTSAKAGVVMLANKRLLETHDISKDCFSSKEDTVQALISIRKAEPGIAPCYFDLSTLQQMFGARSLDQQGCWQDKFFQEETLEALEWMNYLYKERLLDQDVFTMTQSYLLSQLREEKVFLAATSTLYPILQALPENDPIWEAYEIVGPISPDSGKPFQFRPNYDEQYASTVFMTNSDFPKAQVRLLLCFCHQTAEFTPQQELAASAGGFTDFPECCGFASGSVGGVYEEYAEATIPYEILFAHYADTRLSNIFESVENYRQSQVVRMIVSTPQSEVEQIYQETLLEMENRDNSMLIQWKQNKYQQARELADAYGTQTGQKKR